MITPLYDYKQAFLPVIHPVLNYPVCIKLRNYEACNNSI